MKFRNSEHRCALHKEREAVSDVSAPGGSCLPKGGPRYLIGCQLKIKVDCITPFYCVTPEVQPNDPRVILMSCRRHFQVGNVLKAT